MKKPPSQERQSFVRRVTENYMPKRLASLALSLGVLTGGFAEPASAVFADSAPVAAASEEGASPTSFSAGQQVCRKTEGLSAGDTAIVSAIAIDAQSPGNGTVFTSASPNSGISTINFGQDNQLFPNLAAAEVGSDSRVCVKVNKGKTGFILDLVAGIKSETPEGDPVVENIGRRVVDTRNQGGAVRPGESRFVTFPGGEAGEFHFISTTTFGAEQNGDAVISTNPGVRNNESNVTHVQGVAVPKFMAVKLGEFNGNPGIWFNERNTTVGFVVDDLLKVTPDAQQYFNVFSSPKRVLDLRPKVQEPGSVIDFNVPGGQSGDVAVVDLKQTGATGLGNFLVAPNRRSLNAGTSTGNIYNMLGRISSTGTGITKVGSNGSAVTENRFAAASPVFDAMALIESAVMKSIPQQRLYNSREPGNYPDDTPYVPTKPENRRPLPTAGKTQQDWNNLCWDVLPPRAVEEVFSNPRAAQASGLVDAYAYVNDRNQNNQVDVYKGSSDAPIDSELACAFDSASDPSKEYLFFGWDADGEMTQIINRFN